MMRSFRTRVTFVVSLASDQHYYIMCHGIVSLDMSWFRLIALDVVWYSAGVQSQLAQGIAEPTVLHCMALGQPIRSAPQPSKGYLSALSCVTRATGLWGLDETGRAVPRGGLFCFISHTQWCGLFRGHRWFCLIGKWSALWYHVPWYGFNRYIWVVFDSVRRDMVHCRLSGPPHSSHLYGFGAAHPLRILQSRISAPLRGCDEGRAGWQGLFFILAHRKLPEPSWRRPGTESAAAPWVALLV